MARKKKSLESTLLVLLFVFGSIGAYMVFANSSKPAKTSTINQAKLQIDQKDFSKYTTAKPSLIGEEK